MADPKFYRVAGPFSVAQLAEICNGTVHEGSDPDRLLRDVAPLQTAGPSDLSFFDNPRYAAEFTESKAGACVVHPERTAAAPATMALLISDDPYRSYGRIARAFYPSDTPKDAAISPRAIIDETATLGDDVSVGHGAIIGKRCEIGRGTRIEAMAVIGDGVVIGKDCQIGSHASLAYCILGDGVRVFAGARIGEDGFGFAADEEQGALSIPQLGRVLIENRVEIGANSTIDRGSGPDTIIGEGSRIDNLVQIGHNVELGRGCIVVAQAGISGSSKLEDYAVVAAQGGIAGHLTIGKGARVGAKAGVMRDVPPDTSVVGSPAVPVKQFFRQVAAVQRLAGKKGR